MLANLRIPAELLPSDGRFGSGPSKIRTEQIDALVSASTHLLGTSHRQSPVKNLVGSVRDQLRELFGLSENWQVLIGNGGASLFWDAATFGLINERSQHYVFGEFSSKFAQAVRLAPHLGEPLIVESPAGNVPAMKFAQVDTYCLTHNETSTGAVMNLLRPAQPEDALVVVDATSAAGSIAWSPNEVDVYYFSPQKGFASEGGTFIALCSPRAIERIESIAKSKRWCPASLDLSIALENSKANQTYNTPSISTFVLLNQQLKWMLDNGGMQWCVKRTTTSAKYLYDWAEQRKFASPFVSERQFRSPVVGTIDLVGVDANDVNSVLRANKIVDTDSYRKLGRNQLRISMFPAVEPTDVQKLTACIDFIVGAIS
ncbi:MAG: phosphoserine transaminase [Acidimicrobiaceae bacterium]|nr:phosphoserine transaminase [Acidimicrobiaceae bacterium]